MKGFARRRCQQSWMVLGGVLIGLVCSAHDAAAQRSSGHQTNPQAQAQLMVLQQHLQQLQAAMQQYYAMLQQGNYQAQRQPTPSSLNQHSVNQATARSTSAVPTATHVSGRYPTSPVMTSGNSTTPGLSSTTGTSSLSQGQGTAAHHSRNSSTATQPWAGSGAVASVANHYGTTGLGSQAQSTLNQGPTTTGSTSLTPGQGGTTNRSAKSSTASQPRSGNSAVASVANRYGNGANFTAVHANPESNQLPASIHANPEPHEQRTHLRDSRPGFQHKPLQEKHDGNAAVGRLLGCRRRGQPLWHRDDQLPEPVHSKPKLRQHSNAIEPEPPLRHRASSTPSTSGITIDIGSVSGGTVDVTIVNSGTAPKR